MKTTLEIYCGVVGWQGGTIHQAMTDFVARPMPEKDRICNALMRALDAKELADVPTAGSFFKARIS